MGVMFYDSLTFLCFSSWMLAVWGFLDFDRRMDLL
jgi:hypothetical protein